MALRTTCIGAFPKPDYVPVRDWFQTDLMSAPTGDYEAQVAAAGGAAAVEALFRRAACAVIADQIAAGIDLPTDGEVRRENYVHYHCRHLEGIDFRARSRKVLRDGAYAAELPTVVGPVAPRGVGFLAHDYTAAQACTGRPVKVTLPGPLTIADTTADRHYGDEAALCRALAQAINAEVLALAQAGCRYIQIDEPLFARKVEAALAFGIENLERCFYGLPEGVTRVVHMCCGYPDHLDDEDYKKADPQAYFALAEAMDRAAVDQVSIEDAHRHNDLALLERYRRTTVILGVVTVARSRVEPSEAIAERLGRALQHIERERLWAAPDCGLGLLGRDLALAKLRNLSAAARQV